MKKQAKGPKFRAGQVAVLKTPMGEVFVRVQKVNRDFACRGREFVSYTVNDVKMGSPAVDLRPLTVREAGPARGRKRNGN